MTPLQVGRWPLAGLVLGFCVACSSVGELSVQVGDVGADIEIYVGQEFHATIAAGKSSVTLEGEGLGDEQDVTVVVPGLSCDTGYERGCQYKQRIYTITGVTSELDLRGLLQDAGIGGTTFRAQVTTDVTDPSETLLVDVGSAAGIFPVIEEHDWSKPHEVQQTIRAPAGEHEAVFVGRAVDMEGTKRVGLARARLTSDETAQVQLDVTSTLARSVTVRTEGAIFYGEGTSLSGDLLIDGVPVPGLGLADAGLVLKLPRNEGAFADAKWSVGVSAWGKRGSGFARVALEDDATEVTATFPMVPPTITKPSTDNPDLLAPFERGSTVEWSPPWTPSVLVVVFSAENSEGRLRWEVLLPPNAENCTPSSLPGGNAILGRFDSGRRIDISVEARHAVGDPKPSEWAGIGRGKLVVDWALEERLPSKMQ